MQLREKLLGTYSPLNTTPLPFLIDFGQLKTEGHGKTNQKLSLKENTASETEGFF